MYTNENIEITQLTIPASVTTIPDEFFSGCSSLTSVDGLSNVTTIGAYAFSQCSSLAFINLSNVQSIGNYAFEYCSSLTSIDLSNVQSIGNWAFVFCSELQLDDLSNVTSVGEWAFSGCRSFSSIDLSNATTIGNSAFSNCDQLQSIELSNVTSLGGAAFMACGNLKTVTGLSKITRIEESTFAGCGNLMTISGTPTITYVGGNAFSSCAKFDFNGFDFSNATYIGGVAFCDCNSLKSIDLSNVKFIGMAAFQNCHNLESVGVLSNITRIEHTAFEGCRAIDFIYFSSDTPARIDVNGNIFDPRIVILVSASAVNDYLTADGWNEYTEQILADIGVDYNVTLIPQSMGSALLTAIGDENVKNVVSLKVTGQINGYDVFVLRNKMPHLRQLDLSDADIVADTDHYTYYQDFYTEDNVIGNYMFNQSGISRLVLPKSITRIEPFAFWRSRVKEIIVPEGVIEIGYDAFSEMEYLKTVTLPSTLTSLGSCAFYGNYRLESVNLPAGLKEIQGGTFSNCSALREVNIPSSISIIGQAAFDNCSSIPEIVLPSALTRIDDSAFHGCNAIRVVKATAVDPNTLAITEETFPKDVYNKATLYIPLDEETGWYATYNAYFWNTQWGQFSNIDVWTPNYDYITVNDDYNQDAGTIPGESINADFGSEAGYILGENASQTFDEVNITDDGTTGGSIVADGNISINDLHCNISITANRWYFFCFPFDIHLGSISYVGNFVWHEYDGAERALSRGGWKKMGSNAVLKAGKGYIFQGNKDGTLTFMTQNPDLKRKNKNKDLDTHTSENSQDASWNFIGNPYLSYFDMDELHFDAPITIWNGYGYDAIRPGDDDYHFQPYQAFFVQKPTGSTSIDFNKEGQETYGQSQAALSAAKARRANAAINPNRRIVNLTISDGETTDKTRVVLNDSKSREYEMECDASKFFSTESIPQLYTVDGNVNYAINERPVENGIIALGFKANKEDEYTISAPRMDAHCLLKDNETGLLIDLQNGGYTFSSKVGDNNERFSLIVTDKATGIDETENSKSSKSQSIYDLNGRKVQEAQRGVVIKDGQKVIVK